MIRLRLVYDPPSPGEGTRFLVDRLWPRGLSKETLKMDAWLKEVAPGDALRRWFGHDPVKWAEFQRRYFAELDSAPAGLQTIREAERKGTMTLLFAARDAEHNNAVALKAYLEYHPDI